ncbi:hypothetical protein [Desulfosporosinus lacus]|uniref:hypothetical protein n=1 Tax=Desulfosporosinus lacus TaxID=329936 RepID=UPI001160F8C1|nr:hypothetical protein [Desulfosporosinus lacus]
MLINPRLLLILEHTKALLTDKLSASGRDITPEQIVEKSKLVLANTTAFFSGFIISGSLSFQEILSSFPKPLYSSPWNWLDCRTECDQFVMGTPN